MSIKVIAVGKIKDRYLKEAISDYAKQIDGLDIIEIADEKNQNGLEKEGNRILSKINQNDYVIALVIKGIQLTSEQMAEKIDHIQTFMRKDIIFVIGGSYGLSLDVINRSDFQLSFSKMTFPHQMARLMLFEQIFRASSILKSHPYHK